MYFRKYKLQKAWLIKCLKGSVSEEPLTDNMANGTKHCWNLNNSRVAIFMSHCVGNCIEKNLF